MRRSLLILTFFVLFSVPAWSFQMIFDQNLPNGAYYYRPVGQSPSTIKPTIGLAPSSVEIRFDFSLAPAGYKEAVQGAFSTWESVPGATYTLRDDGDQICTPMIGCYINNGMNNLIWVPSNWPSFFGSSSLAITTFEQMDYSTGAVWETDIYFNGGGFKWFIGNTPDPDGYDLVSTATHELGHVACLNDIYDYHFYKSVMYGYLNQGDMSDRILTDDDMDGLRFLYPNTEADLPAPGITVISTDELHFYNTAAGNQGEIYNYVVIEGYGFIFTNLSQSATIETTIWQNGSPVSAPLAGNLAFNDSAHLQMTIDFSQYPATGEYDLVVTNPNGKSGALMRGVQANAPDNAQPTVSITASTVEGYIGSAFSMCAKGHDPDGPSPLIYQWTMVEWPKGASAPSLINSDQKCVTFTPTVGGWYALEVAAGDGIVWSATDGMEIKITPQPPSGSEGGGRRGCGCAMTGGQPHGTVMPLVIIFPLWYLIRRRLILRHH